MILLDTHVLVWWLAGGERLSARATREIAKAEPVLVSPVSCWEVAMLVGKGRVGLDRDVRTWIADVLDDERIEIAALSPQAATGGALLADEGFEGDPADQLLYATARDLLVPFVTKDARIRAFARETGEVHTIW